MLNMGMNEIEGSLNQQELTQLVQLLQLAQAQDNSSQAQVFQTLRTIEQNPLSYVYLTYLFATPRLALPLRKLAGLTMSSALKRNSAVVHFEASEMGKMKLMLLEAGGGELEQIRSVMVSCLICRENFDYELFDYLIAGMGSHPEHIGMINIILEDLRFKNENYNLFEEQSFLQAIHKIYSSVFALTAGGTVQQLAQNAQLAAYLKCLNLLIFHTPNHFNSLLSHYISALIAPILLHSQQHPASEQVVQHCLLAVTEFAGTKAWLIDTDFRSLLVGFNPPHSNSPQISKIWTNIMMDLIDNDEDDAFAVHLPTIVPRAVQGLTFTAADQAAIKEEIDTEVNPYANEDSLQSEQGEAQVEGEGEGETLEGSYGAAWGSTLRKLSFQLIEKISIHYAEGFWEKWKHWAEQKMRSAHAAESQTAISFIATISETCIQDISQDLQPLVGFLMQRATDQNPPLLRATAIWTLEKLYCCFHSNTEVVLQSMKLVFGGMLNESGQGTTVLMMKQACISYLDAILSYDELSAAMSQEVLQLVISSLTQGLSMFRGRALFNIFKALSSIFENSQLDGLLTAPLCHAIVNELCRKWAVSEKNDSIMCPLLQCLITACERKKLLLQPFMPAFFQQLLPLLPVAHRKSLTLRCIDFLCALVSTGSPCLAAAAVSPPFLQTVYALVTSEEKEVRHFIYGLIGDIARSYDFSAYAERFVVVIGQSMDEGSLTSQNNALMCITDLLVGSPALAPQYAAQLQLTVANIVSKQSAKASFTTSIYAHNFARIFGRLAYLHPLHAKGLLLSQSALLPFLFAHLRSKEVTPLSSSAFRGLVATLDLFSSQELQTCRGEIGEVVEALVCYPLRNERTAANEELLGVFVRFVRELRQKMGEGWREVVGSPIMLPGLVRTLQSWVQ